MATSRICSVPECSKPSRSLGMCRLHYQRFWAHGDPHGGRTPHGAPLRYLNDVVLPYEGDECLVWPFSGNADGYAAIHIDGHRRLVSTVVCETVYGSAPSSIHQAAHSCGGGNRGCVTKRHLSWKTPKENQADRLVHGTHDRGERSVNAKLREADVLAIKSLRGTLPAKVIGDRFGVCRQTVNAIHAGKSWAWLK